MWKYTSYPELRTTHSGKLSNNNLSFYLKLWRTPRISWNFHMLHSQWMLYIGHIRFSIPLFVTMLDGTDTQPDQPSAFHERTLSYDKYYIGGGTFIRHIPLSWWIRRFGIFAFSFLRTLPSIRFITQTAPSSLLHWSRCRIHVCAFHPNDLNGITSSLVRTQSRDTHESLSSV